MSQLKTKIAIIDEEHYVVPNTTVRLEHDNIVVNSVVSNVPVNINYKEGKITTLHPHMYDDVVEGEIKVIISYYYEE